MLTNESFALFTVNFPSDKLFIFSSRFSLKEIESLINKYSPNSNEINRQPEIMYGLFVFVEKRISVLCTTVSEIYFIVIKCTVRKKKLN